MIYSLYEAITIPVKTVSMEKEKQHHIFDVTDNITIGEKTCVAG